MDADGSDDEERAALEMRYPMYVMPVESVLSFETMQVHEDLFTNRHLPRPPHLVQWKEGMRDAIFVTHTWLGYSHPDPGGKKFQLLKDILIAAKAASLHFLPHWVRELESGFSAKAIGGKELQQMTHGGYIWLDLSCVPQRDQEKMLLAIHSIPLYAAASSLFLCLAPSDFHEDGNVRDYLAWTKRGWCRLEEFANANSPNKAKRFVVAESMSSLFIPSVTDSFLRGPVCTGVFVDDRDRQKLEPVVKSIVLVRRKLALEQKDFQRYRLMHAAMKHFLRGTNYHQELRKDLDAWMKRMRFAKASDETASGWTPLRFAAYGAELRLMEQLLQSGASAASPLRATGLGHTKGNVIVAGMCRFTDSAEAAQLLLRYRARLDTIDSIGHCPLHFAVIAGRLRILDAMLAHDRQAAATLDPIFAATPIQFSTVQGSMDTVKHMFTKYPEWCTPENAITKGGIPPVLASCLIISSAEQLRLLHSLGCDVDEPHTAATHPMCIATMAFSEAMCYSQRNPSEFFKFYANMRGATPLLMTSYFGQVSSSVYLLGARANVHNRNSYGRTPLILASMRGHMQNATLLLEARADALVRDCWGRSALEWARRSSHARLVERLQTIVDASPSQEPGVFFCRCCQTQEAEESTLIRSIASAPSSTIDDELIAAVAAEIPRMTFEV